jgi:hypothetical protein
MTWIWPSGRDGLASDGAALRLDAATVEILRSPGRV